MSFVELSKKFVLTGSEAAALSMIRYCRTNELFAIGTQLTPRLMNIFPHNVDILDECAMCNYYQGNKKDAYEIYQQIINFRGLSEERAKSILFNAHFCFDAVKDNYITYPGETIPVSQDHDFVTFSITTCKRLDLFKKTMNSFLNCCLDTYRIDKWLCVDDNSSEEDREEMKRLYPFFEFIFKGPEQKGHVASMNIIRERVQTPYLFHIEDDWQFFIKRNYISDCLEVLGQNERYGQCLLNKNYMETIKDRHLIGGEFKTTQTGLRYYIHEHYTDQNEFRKKRGNGISCSYWPHFSFRPSLHRMSVWRLLGSFPDTTAHFEMKYAELYKSKGFVSTFLEDIYCFHIGRLTSERFDNSKLNAYVLNGVSQFTETGLQKKEEELNQFLEKTNFYVINLDRRPDRYEKFKEINKVNDVESWFKRFKAVDGQELQPSVYLRVLFSENDYNWRKGILGCACSHIKLWSMLSESKKYDRYIIVEDDALLVPNFVEKLASQYKTLKDDWDILFFGHHIIDDYKDNNTFSLTETGRAEKWNMYISLQKSRGGTFGYMISKSGAQKMLSYICKTKMVNAIDTVMQKASNILNIYYSTVHLARSECYCDNFNTDTDIQKDYDSLYNQKFVDVEHDHYDQDYIIKPEGSMKKDFTDLTYFISTRSDKIIEDDDYISNLLNRSNERREYSVYGVKFVLLDNNVKRPEEMDQHMLIKGLLENLPK